LQPAFVNIPTHAGDAARYLFKQPLVCANPAEEQRYLFSLANFRDIALLRQTMEMTSAARFVRRTRLTCCIRCSATMLHGSRRGSTSSATGRLSLASFDSALPRMCEAINGLLDRQHEVEAFFSSTRCASAAN
jgi:hypothetical protein